jgi:peptidoglycan/LPS O-acetylase OafA/YrhL
MTPTLAGAPRSSAAATAPAPRGGPDDGSPLPLSPRADGRLVFLDGIRALGSLYVVLHHCCQIYQDPSATPRYGYYAFIPWLLRGRSVAVFMVLSGFCLMLPVAKSAAGTLRDGFAGYLRRRARRILPPYYVAVALTLAMIALVPGMNRASGEFWGRALPVFSKGNLLSHALLLHFLSPAWNYRINPPLWTLGTEWALYFIFPLLLLPIWRRFGLVTLVVAGMVMGFLPLALLGKAWNFSWSCPWFIGLFAIGMSGAVLQVGPNPSKKSIALRRFAAGPWAAGILVLGFASLWKFRIAMDFLFGASTIWVILRCGSKPGEHRFEYVQSGLTALLQWRPMLALGRFSYSVYLIHGPVLMLIYRRIDGLGLSANARAAVMFLVAPPVALAVAWLFHRAVERPLMPAPGKSATRAPVNAFIKKAEPQAA